MDPPPLLISCKEDEDATTTTIRDQGTWIDELHANNVSG
jgi:anti-sigma regulatory factor (Ser/Thr protein kinase)